MRIQSSDISLYSAHSYKRKTEERESLKAWIGSRRPDFEGTQATSPAKSLAARLADTIDLSKQAKSVNTAVAETSAAGDDKAEVGGKDGVRILLIEKFIEGLTGKKFKIKIPTMGGAGNGQAAGVAAGQAQQPAQQTQGWGLEYDYHKSEYESETTTFSAAGTILTSDGKEIAIQAELTMSREFMAEQNISIRAGDAVRVDPLVINFSGTAAQLTTTKFSFDIDSNGTEEQVSFLKPGSGFLALDKNGDGQINDGSELFGPQTGSGFAELAEHDEDGNGWIDEGDSIFSKLRIWTKDEDGTDRLMALGQQGVGAIYLGSAQTAFALNDADNQSLGGVKDTGIFLNENGSAGTVQEIDLTV